MLEQPLLFTAYSSIQFFNSLLFPNRVSYATLGSLHITVQTLCDLRDAMPCHWSASASHQTFA